MILVDTCVLIDVAETESEWSQWSARMLAYWSDRGPLVISPTVFAEWSAMFSDVSDVDSAVAQFGLSWQDTPRAALFLASQAHQQYRRRGGLKSMVLPDFLIGAHAAVARMPILTRDPRRFTACFADLEIVFPN